MGTKTVQKILFIFVAGIFSFWLVCLFGSNSDFHIDSLKAPHVQAISSGAVNVNLVTSVNEYLNLTISSGGSINLGSINADIPACNVSGTVLVVATNAANGYKITPTDGSDTNSVLKHTDNITYIPDFSASIGSPASWVTGSTKGLGVTLWSGAQREAAWSVGGVPLDACAPVSTKWAGVPADDIMVSGHAVTGYLATPDSTYWGWKLEISNVQKSGEYTGLVTFTVIPVLS